MREAVAIQPSLLFEAPNNILDREEWQRYLGPVERNTIIFNEDIALSAVSRVGEFIHRLAPEFRCKKEIILEAARNHASVSQIWECMTEEQKNDRAFIIELIQANPNMIYGLSTDLQKDEELKRIFDESLEVARQRQDEEIEKHKLEKNEEEKVKKTKIDIKTVSIQVRDEVARQEAESEILIAVLLDKRAKMIGYDNYGTQRLYEEKGKPLSSHELSDDEKKEIEKLTQKIEELKGREINE